MTSIFDIVSSSYLPIDTIYQEVEKRIASGTFISYAQNREDVYINRLFSDLSRGTYIDVGCFDPVLKSTTCALYRRGWRGINIDVSAQNIQKFIHERPADFNINSAIGSKNTSKDIYLYEGSTSLHLMILVIILLVDFLFGRVSKDTNQHPGSCPNPSMIFYRLM